MKRHRKNGELGFQTLLTIHRKWNVDAVDAERETDELKKAEYMEDKIGEEYDGIISSVTNFGLFVELPNTIEGLVHVSYMTDDYYRYDERHLAMIGERTGNVYRIGDEITIRVINVNKDERSIDFEIVGMKGTRRREPNEGTRVFKTGGSSERKPRSSKSGSTSSKEKVVGRVEEERQVEAVNQLRKKVETKNFSKTHRKQSVRKNGKTAIKRIPRLTRPRNGVPNVTEPQPSRMISCSERGYDLFGTIIFVKMEQ